MHGSSFSEPPLSRLPFVSHFIFSSRDSLFSANVVSRKKVILLIQEKLESGLEHLTDETIVGRASGMVLEESEEDEETNEP
ncbi:hypothetical protein TNIN_478271 [Trichonephila inaurata madagascariensis]|uniref:Uncharacterized protein n=1 Tax=Trichonephila inaurata madagascariensis TaxID=2747483 RepID=A0A8X7CAA6_9ARAC|nr:hypothetical protein TNIN_478271 [Trichonephila inaurata madagascariensis]